MSAFTKGPWYVSGARAGKEYLVCHGDAETFTPVIAETRGAKERTANEQEANARLLALAPEMYAELARLYGILVGASDTLRWAESELRTIRRILERAEEGDI